MTETYPSMDELDELSFRSYAMFVQSKLMSSIFDLEKLVEISIDAFVELMRVDVGFIMLFDEKSQQLSVEAVKGLKRHTLRKTRINVDKDIIQGLIERKDAIFLSKLEKETLPIRILFQKIVEKVGGDIVLSIPLVIKKDLLGLVNLSRREFEAPFKQTDLQFLYTLAGYVAIAIENANLHRKKIEVEKSRIIEHKRSEEKTREYSKNLERMVKERTKELSRALYDTEEARDKIDGILKSVADGLIVTDTYTRIILMNRAAEDLLSVRFSEVINRPIDVAIHDETLRQRFKKSLTKREPGYQFDFELPGENSKHPRIIRARTSEIKDKAGNQTGIISIIYDVTLEREVDKMKTEFLSTASHQLRTPLTSILGFSEILMTRDNIKEKQQKEFISYINKQSVNLANIINDLLDISRIESGIGFTLYKVPCNINEIIKETVKYFQASYPKRQFDIILPKEPVEVKVDKDKIGQVLENLLSNAVKYSPEGGSICLTAKKISKFAIEISVADHGIGMSPDQIKQIFDKFYRADASNSAIPGTGLGMSIVKNYVEAHGGKVWVESELRKGTKVIFIIPGL